MDKNYIHHVRNSKEVQPQEKETKESMAEKHHHGHSRRGTAKSRGDLEGRARLNKEFRKAANADKRDYLKERCQHLEQYNNNPKEVSKVIKKITGKWAPQTEVINDKDGNTLTE